MQQDLLNLFLSACPTVLDWRGQPFNNLPMAVKYRLEKLALSNFFDRNFSQTEIECLLMAIGKAPEPLIEIKDDKTQSYFIFADSSFYMQDSYFKDDVEVRASAYDFIVNVLLEDGLYVPKNFAPGSSSYKLIQIVAPELLNK